MNHRLPDDVKRQCLAIVQGYDRRRKWYLEELEKKTPDLENNIKFKQNYAIDDAKMQIGIDIIDDLSRQKLIKAIIINCEEPRRYPHRYLDVGISEDKFYEERNKFLYNVAQYLQIV